VSETVRERPAVLRLWGAVERLAETALVGLMTAMIVVCLAQVVVRYILSVPLTWSEEAANYLLVWTSFLAAWQAWRWRAHLGFDLLVLRLPGGAQHRARQAVEAIVGMFGLGCAIAGLPLLEMTADQPSAILELPMAWVYAACPVAGLLIAGDVAVTWASGRREEYAPVDIT